MTELLFRVAVVSAAVSVVLLPLLLVTRWQRRYAPHTRRAVWLAVAVVLLAAPLLPKSQAPVQIEVPERTVVIQAHVPQTSQAAIAPAPPVLAGQFDQSAEAAEPVLAETRTVRTLEWGAALTALWLTGGAAVLIWQGARYLLARRRLRKEAVSLTGYEELAKALCPGRRVRFFLVNGLGTPMTLGVLRPVVLLPDGDVRQAAVCHELTHVRRWDVAWKYLLLLACAVHWFNPLVWVMSRRCERDMEASCDAAVVAGGSAAERRAYGELLIQTAAGRDIPFTTRFGGGKRLMKARLYDLFHPGKKSRVLVGVVLLLCLLAGSLVACRSAQAATAGEAVQALEESVVYENGVLSFTIPSNYAPGEDWNIHIAGRAEAGGLGGISLHYLDGEQWEAGKTYTLDITEDQWADITELTMDVVLGEEDRTIDLLAVVDRATNAERAEYEPHQIVLPSSLLEKNSYNADIFEIDPFAVNLYLPAGWTVQEAAGMLREGQETYPVVDGLFSVQCILDETGRPVGSLGYNLAPTYEDATDDPMALFAGITMAKHFFDCRETFEPVLETDGLLVATADVVQDYSANEGREETRNRGILLRDEKAGVYAAIELDSGALTGEQVLMIAERLSLSMPDGTVSETVDVPEEVLKSAERWAALQALGFEREVAACDQWSLDSLELVRQEPDVEGTALEIYQVTYRLHTPVPVDGLLLPGSAEIDADGWYTPSFSGCHYMVFKITPSGVPEYMWTAENDRVPDREAFIGDMLEETARQLAEQKPTQYTEVYNNERYGFSLCLPDSWTGNYSKVEEDGVVNFYCLSLAEQDGWVARLLIESKPLEQTDDLRLLGENEGCCVYLQMGQSQSDLPADAVSSALPSGLYRTMYEDMENLPDGALTWWDGYTARIHPVTGESSRMPADEAVLERILRGE